MPRAISAAYPGLFVEQLPSGNLRYRVRAAGRPSLKITLTVGPGHHDFLRQYEDARDGRRTQRDSVAKLRFTGDLDWHVNAMIKGARYRSRKKGAEVSITTDDLLEMLMQQECRCAVSGIEFDLRKSEGQTRRAFAPSIDRIDNGLPYVRSNIMLTCAIVNTARADWPDADFRKMCEEIVKHG